MIQEIIGARRLDYIIYALSCRTHLSHSAKWKSLESMDCPIQILFNAFSKGTSVQAAYNPGLDTTYNNNI